MATYFVSKDGNGTGGTTDPGTSGAWTVALATLGAAMSAATTAGDVIKISDEHFENLASDTTYTIAESIRIIVVDHDDTSVASTMDYTNSYIGHKTLNRSITFNSSTAGYNTYMRGVCFVVTGSDSIILNLFRGHIEIEDAILQIGTPGVGLRFGGPDRPCGIRITNTEIKWTTATSSIEVAGADVELINVSVTGATQPNELFASSNSNDSTGSSVTCIGCDFSGVTGTLCGINSNNYSTLTARFIQCKLGASVTWLEASATFTGHAYWKVHIHDCHSGDEHFHYGYADDMGTLTIDTGIYANDGAEYNSTGTKHSWKIVTTANASIYFPFKTPWISVYNEGTSAITPSLEIVRSGSATAYQNDEVWSEWIAKTTSGSTRATFNDSDKVATPLTTPANQDTGALDASGWTGENATSWFGKLSPTASFTPAEIGDIAVRVCVGEPSITVYVDPQIRGLS